MEFLRQLDFSLLQVINGTLTHPYATAFFAFITDLHKMPVVKFGLFPALLGFWIWRKRWAAVRVIVVCAVAVSASDLLGHRLIKPQIARPRPFLEQEAHAELRLPYQPGGFSFPSNHASNGFVTASMLSWYFPASAWVLYPYAVLVSYSRPYLGVHYPFDVIGGALWGLLIAALVKLAVRRWAPQWGPPPS